MSAGSCADCESGPAAMQAEGHLARHLVAGHHDYSQCCSLLFGTPAGAGVFAGVMTYVTPAEHAPW